MPVKKDNIQALIDKSPESKFYRFKLGDDSIKSEGVYLLNLNSTQFSLIGDLSTIHSNLGESTGYFIKNGKYLVLEERDYSTIYVPINVENF